MDRARLARWLGRPVDAATPVGGGDTATALRVRCGEVLWFVKTVPAARKDSLRAEAFGLEALRAADALRVPAVELQDSDESHAWLVLEWLDLSPATAASAARLGTGLARQHRSSAEAYGLDHDNLIGRSVQRNGWHDDWAGFFQTRRLGVQCAMAREDSATAFLVDRLERLIEHLPALLSGASTAPSLLHGDLWGGNWATAGGDKPVVFDPAVYFGHREADLAMTELFGGFPAAFYSAYRAAWPLAPGYNVRREVYNLYHVLNHANLFGGGYVTQASERIDALLCEAR